MQEEGCFCFRTNNSSFSVSPCRSGQGTTLSRLPAALYNVARVMPAGSEDPPFSWQDGESRVVMGRMNEILEREVDLGYPFRVGGASYQLG